MNICLVIRILIVIFIITGITAYLLCENIDYMVGSNEAKIILTSALLILVITFVIAGLSSIVLSLTYRSHYPNDCVVDYTSCQTQTIDEYYEQDGSLYVVVGDETYLITHKEDDNYIKSNECIVKQNDEYFSNCFVDKSETVIYREKKWNWFTEKAFGKNTLYVNNEVYNKLLNITPLDIN